MEPTNISTEDLQKELTKREGVDTYRVAPCESYVIHIGDRTISGTGPVIIIVNRD